MASISPYLTDMGSNGPVFAFLFDPSMKLATLNDGTRDGQLAVVARDLKTAHLADGIAATLQAALDDWAFIGPQLEALSVLLNAGRAQRSFEFQPKDCMAPLPRVYQRAVGCAYPQALELDYKVRQAALPELLREEPRMFLAAGDELLGPHDEITLAHAEWGIDFEAGLAVVSGDVPMGATPDQAMAQIRLLLLVNQVVLRNVAVSELEKGGGPLQAYAAAACAAVAVTPDEFDDAWKGGKVCLPLRSSVNGKLVGQPQAGADMRFNFPQLLAHLARSRPVRAGTVVGAGPVSNKDAKRGVASLAEARNLEQLAKGAPLTPFLAFDDTLKVEMLGGDAKSVFGAIEHTLKPYLPGKNGR